MGRWWLAVAVFAGCYSPATERPCKVTCDSLAGAAAICPGDQECMGDNLCHAPGDPSCPPPDEIDAPLADLALIDLPNVGPPYCFGSQNGLFNFCSDSLSNADLMFSFPISTQNAGNCFATPMSGTNEVCVIYANTITITGNVRVTGMRPLVLVAVQTINIQGKLDASSRKLLGDGAGAGVAPALCPPPQDPIGQGGAAGGTFRGQGGNGGAAAAASQGTAPGPFPPLTVRGGCPGGSSGSIDGNPGLGGGALYLIAGSGIIVGGAGRIDVSGAGARGGDGGGMGGGSGGLIVLDAAQLQVQGELMANGGGGSSGFNAGVSADGGESSAPAVPAAGGGGTSGLHGGPGSAGSASLVGGAGAGMGAGFFGGGGGGGGGWIYYLGGSLVPTNKMSPPPIPL